MKNILLIALLISGLFAIMPCNANPIPFVPIVRNYKVTDYNAGNQNWSIAQDKQGIMYFGNNKGLLEYDGHYWNLYPLPTNGIIRSVYVSDDDKIYVGSFEEFGYFQRNDTGRLIYQSLKPTVGDYNFHNDEIWNILPADGKILFHSFGSYFIYDGNKTTGYKMNKLPLNFFTVGNTLYSQQIDGGLNIFSENQFHNFISRQPLGNDDVITGLPHPNGILLMTRNNGCFLYDNGELTPWQTDYDRELKKNTINKGIITRDSCYVIGTISDGVYAFNSNGQLLWKLNADIQLGNNTVLSLCNDTENNLWVGLDNGIAYIHNSSDISYFKPQSGRIGMIYDILVEKDRAYLASNQGLYCLEGSTGVLNMVPGMSEQAWTIGRWGNQIVCGHNKGVFSISGNKASLMSDVKGGMCVREGKIDDENILIQGTYALPNIYKKNSEGNWYFSNEVAGFSHMANNIELDHRGNVWVEHMRRGLYRFRLSDDLKKAVDIRFYRSLDPENPRDKCYLFNINGRVAFSDGNSFYTHNDITDSIVPYTVMNEQLRGIKNIHSVNHHQQNMYWFLSDREAYLIECNLTDFKIVRKIPFSIFENPPIERRAKIVFDKSRNCSYLCLDNSVAKITYNNDSKSDNIKKQLYLAEFKAVNSKANTTGYYPLKAGNKLPASFNHIEITLACPAYNQPEVYVRYKLEGLSDTWTESNNGFKSVYTHLPSGNYRFVAELFDEKGTTSRVELRFVIASPWYLSHIAIVSYIIIFLSLITLLLYAVYSFAKRKKDKVIERERIAHQSRIQEQEKKIIELENSRLEADLKFKSKELSGVIMTNIAHQEFLQAIKTEIQQQKLSGQYTRKNLDRLLSMLNQNIVSDEDNWNIFQANFDRIHENFFRNLKEQYPDLTSGDLRLCGLLRLNLPTKEISKLMNISIRGVDAARYRLRKKLGLPQESSLTDFMINFK